MIVAISLFVLYSDDNNAATCASNFDAVNPVRKVQRHIKGNQEKDEASQTLMIANYTAGIGGVDVMDRLLSAYRPQRRKRSGRGIYSSML